MLAIDIQHLNKVYKNGTVALQDVSIQVKEGDFYGLLGPNGAGKSTMIGILTSLTLKTSGFVSVMGHDIDHDFSKAKACIGVTPQEFNFNGFKKVINVLIEQAGYYGISSKVARQRGEKYLRQLHLWDKRNSICRSLSGGMKRRLMIARALIHEPKILILDEPTAGVDIEIRRSMWQFLKNLNEQGTTIILTSHYLEEIELLCRHVGIIDKGNLITNLPISDLLTQLDKERFILYVSSYGDLPEIDGYKIEPIDATTIEVEISKGQGFNKLFADLESAGIQVSSLRNKSNRLEELFLRMTGSGIKE